MSIDQSDVRYLSVGIEKLFIPFHSNVPSSSNIQEEFDKDSISCRLQNVRIKSKNDLDEPTSEGTLLRELFFRKPSVEESGSLDIIPVLSETDLQTRPTNPVLFP